MLPILLVASCVYTEGLEKDEILTVSQTTFGFSNEENSSEFTIQSYCEWKIKCDAEWVSFSDYEDNSKVVKNILNVSENKSVVVRYAQAEIYNTRYDINQKLEIMQQEGVPYIKSSIDSMQVSIEGISEEITIESNIPWSVSCESDWVTVSPSLGGVGENTLSIIIDENTTVYEREAIIKIVNLEYAIAKEIFVSQVEFIPKLNISCDKIENVSIEGINERVTIESNITWSAFCSSDWVILSPSTGGVGENILSIVVQKNTTVEERKAVVKIFNVEYGVTKEIAVVQTEFIPQLNISCDKIENVSTEGTNEEITIESNIPWLVSCESDWVTLSPSSGGVGENTLSIIIDENTTVQEREAIIKIVNSEYAIAEEIFVSQVQFIPELKLSRDTLENISYNGNTSAIIVESNISWLVLCESDWMQVNPSFGYKGKTIVQIKIQENNVELSRESEILIVNEEYKIAKKIVISQSKWVPTINGYEYVDLGLPSGLKWAAYNVGANSPEEYGDYYAWGEIETKDTYLDSNSLTYYKNFTSNISYNPNYDVACKKWGASWYLPGRASFQELIDECEWEWTTMGGNNGYKVTGPNGKSVFLPAAGYMTGSLLSAEGEGCYYWTSSPYETYDYYRAYSLFDLRVDKADRSFGRCIRPVSE